MRASEPEGGWRIAPIALVLPVLALWALDWLATLAILRTRRLPGDKQDACRFWSRLTFWSAVVLPLILLPTWAVDGPVGPALAVVLYLVNSALWALPEYLVARSLRAIPPERGRFVWIAVAARLFPVLPLALWLLVVSLLLAYHLDPLLIQPLPATILVAIFLSLVYYGLPRLLARLFWQTDPWVNRRLITLATALGLPIRRVAVVPTGPHAIANAFVYGEGGGVVFVTDHLLRLLDDRQLDAVLAHELTHLKRRHTWKLLTVSLLLPLLARALPAYSWLVFLTLLLVLYTLLRHFEFEADQGAKALLGSGRPLAEALRTLLQDDLPRARPRRRRAILPFATHPLPEERIRRLLGEP